MAERIISYLKKLFQDYASKDYKNQAIILEGLFTLIFEELADLKKIAQDDTNNPLPPNDSEDIITEE